MGGHDELGATAADGADNARLAPLLALCTTATRTLPVDGAAVSLVLADDERAIVCATDEATSGLDDLHFTLGEGPAVDALELRRPVLVDDLAADTHRRRWPVFSGEASARGTAAVYAFPLQVGAIRLGLLGLYGGMPHVLTESELNRALRLADAAAYAVLDLVVPVGAPGPVKAGADGEAFAEPMAWEFYRAEVHQASGMVMAQLGVSIEEALARLRAYAFAEGTSVAAVARAVVTRELRFER